SSTQAGQYAISFTKDFLAAIPPAARRGDEPFYTALEKAANHAVAVLADLTSQIGKTLPDNIHVEALTFRQANMLRLIELCEFFANYANRHLAYLTATELARESKSGKAPFT